MKEWKHFQEEAAKRDHRKIGRVNALVFLLCLVGYLYSREVLQFFRAEHIFICQQSCTVTLIQVYRTF